MSLFVEESPKLVYIPSSSYIPSMGSDDPLSASLIWWVMQDTQSGREQCITWSFGFPLRRLILWDLQFLPNPCALIFVPFYFLFLI